MPGLVTRKVRGRVFNMHIWELAPGLYQGNIAGLMTSDIACVCTCTYMSEIPGRFASLIYARKLSVSFPFIDEPRIPDEIELRAVVTALAGFVHAGNKVLVTCNEGINRSCLIAGLVMQQMGYKNVVDKIRQVHKQALTNRTFVDYLNSQESKLE